MPGVLMHTEGDVIMFLPSIKSPSDRGQWQMPVSKVTGHFNFRAKEGQTDQSPGQRKKPVYLVSIRTVQNQE